MNPLIKIYGERHTNTNYLSQLIELNLAAKLLPGVSPSCVWHLQRIVPGREWVRDLYAWMTYGRNLGWKHSCVRPVSELRRQPAFKRGVRFITITKNPYAWLLSLYRRPYNRRYRTKPTFVDFLKTPWKTVRRESCAKILESPIDLWNIKNESYAKLADLDCMHVTVEAMLGDPPLLMRSISERLRVPMLSGGFVNYERSTKGDEKKNFDYYRDYYLNERWRDELPREAIPIINARLDASLVGRFGYELL